MAVQRRHMRGEKHKEHRTPTGEVSGRGRVNVTVHKNSSESSEDEAEESVNSHCGTGSVDRGHWRKRLLDCLLPMFPESPNSASIVETPLSNFCKFLTSSMIASVVEQTCTSRRKLEVRSI